jgi:hypothetical protein
VLRVP